jgi:hypothetical protein
MLEHWHEFYELLGTAAAALVALLFVAATIGANIFTSESAGATRTFMSPVVFHYSNIMFLSLIVLIPDQTTQSLGVFVGVAALGSLIYSVITFVRVWRHSAADTYDRLAYGSVPMLVYTCGLVVAWLLLAGSMQAGLDLLAASALLLLVVNIRNAWDLMLSLSRRNAQHQKEIERTNRAPLP